MSPSSARGDHGAKAENGPGTAMVHTGITSGCATCHNGANALGKAQHVDRAMDRCLRRLHRIVLVVDRAGGAGEVPDLIDFHKQRQRHVMAQELEFRVAVQVGDVALLAGEQVVYSEHVLPAGDQPVRQVRAEEARAAGHQRAVLEK